MAELVQVYPIDLRHSTKSNTYLDMLIERPVSETAFQAANVGN